jgi:hypothetical protein
MFPAACHESVWASRLSFVALVKDAAAALNLSVTIGEIRGEKNAAIARPAPGCSEPFA